MRIELFINFDGNCRQAIDHYAKVFGTEIEGLMTFSDAPPTSGFVPSEEDKDRIMYAGLRLGNMTVMFSDCPAGSGFVAGNNIAPTIMLTDKDEITRIFNGLKEGGQVHMDLAQTFFSELFGMVRDKFGIFWQISMDPQAK
ncbi:MAG: VOC family protein [Oscillospiraceae bacterium]|nr:VOC family protein [Oscillospiraceae bacterium]